MKEIYMSKQKGAVSWENGKWGEHNNKDKN